MSHPAPTFEVDFVEQPRRPVIKPPWLNEPPSTRWRWSRARIGQVGRHIIRTAENNSGVRFSSWVGRTLTHADARRRGINLCHRGEVQRHPGVRGGREVNICGRINGPDFKGVGANFQEFIDGRAEAFMPAFGIGRIHWVRRFARFGWFGRRWSRVGRRIQAALEAQGGWRGDIVRAGKAKADFEIIAGIGRGGRYDRVGGSKIRSNGRHNETGIAQYEGAWGPT